MTFMRKLMELMSLKSGVEEAFHNEALKPLLKDPFELPKSVDEFRAHHFRVLRKLNRESVGSHLSGQNSLQVDFDTFVTLLFDMGLLKIGTYRENLENLTVQKLKYLSKELGLKVSGSKNDFIERIISESNESNVSNIIDNINIYFLTDLGKEILDKSIKINRDNELVIFQTAIDNIIAKNFDIAHDIICKQNAEMPIPPGLGVDWAKRYYEGIEKSDEDYYMSSMDESNDKVCTAYNIYSEMSGESIDSVILRSYNIPAEFDNRDIKKRMSCKKYQMDVKRAESTLHSHDKHDKYIFLGTLDMNTCRKCGSLDRHIYSYGEAKIGINYPPMHEGCRCTIIDDFGDNDTNQGQRWARDPITGRSMYVPAHMSYKEWHRKYIKHNEGNE